MGDLTQSMTVLVEQVAEGLEDIQGQEGGVVQALGWSYQARVGLLEMAIAGLVAAEVVGVVVAFSNQARFSDMAAMAEALGCMAKAPMAQQGMQAAHLTVVAAQAGLEAILAATPLLKIAHLVESLAVEVEVVPMASTAGQALEARRESSGPVKKESSPLQTQELCKCG